ncbi:MAG: LysR family transcriptional regulator [Gammaproteobacteria bacterium]|nr:LysR family transcriptional regulator [Gammaproteobacteria bacterium]MCP5415998.1 LysR family transcriptional regulator [Chromatiaceae bacterium]
MIDLNDMIVFASVVDNGTISGAARELGQPKSTISRRVQQLEEELGVRLLQRTTRSLRLTELGATFYERCKKVQAEAEEAERLVSLGQETPRGILRISAPVETGVSRLGTLIAEYSNCYPEVRIVMDLSNRFVDLIDEGYDLAIRAGRLEDSTLVARRLGSSRLVVCASPDYLRKNGTPIKPEELTNHRLALYQDGLQKQRFSFSGPHGRVSVQLEAQHCANSLTVLRDLVKTGYGITLLPESHTCDDVATGRLVLLLKQWKLPAEGIYAVYPSPHHLTPKVQSFIDFLSSQCKLIL